MYGRHPRLPVDMYLGLHPRGESEGPSVGKYVDNLRKRMDYAYKLASEKSGKLDARNKDKHDSRLKDNTLEPGDKVLVRNVGVQGKHKSGDKWGKYPSIVVPQPNPEIPIFKVRPENGVGRERTLHRNLLFPCNFLPVEVEPTPSPQTKKRVPANKEQAPPIQPVISEDEVQEESTQSDDAGVSFWGTPQTNASDEPPPVVPEEANNECKEEVSSTGTSDEETREEVANEEENVTPVVRENEPVVQVEGDEVVNVEPRLEVDEPMPPNQGDNVPVSPSISEDDRQVRRSQRSTIFGNH